MSSGWYACKLQVSDEKVKKVVVACALLMQDVADPAPGGVQIQSMRWCRGLPMEERNSKVFGEVCDSYTIVQPEPKTQATTQIVQPEAKTQSEAQIAKPEAQTHGVKKEPLELDVKARKKRKKAPFARTDPWTQ